MKNLFKFKRKLPFLMILSALCFLTPLPTPAMAPAGPASPAKPGAAMPELSPEDIKMFEEAMKMVDDHVRSLPTRDQLRAQGLSEEQVLKAETREKFDEEVARYSKMSEKELLEEIEKAFADLNKAQPQQPAAEPARPAPAVYVPEIAKEEPVKPAPAPSSNKQQAALQLLDQTIASINNFLQKTEMMAEITSKIPSWAKQGKLRHWSSSMTWNNVRNQIEELEAKLAKIKDRSGPGSSTYKYLDDFIKDEALYNNVTRLKDALIKHEPNIQLGGFGIEKMSSPSRKATRAALSSLVEAIHLMGIPAALDKIVEKYEPIAKKSREAEEAKRKEAFEASKRQRSASPITVSTAPREKTPTKYEGSPSRYNPSSAPSSFDGSRDRKSDEAKKSSLDTKAGGSGSADQAKKEDKEKGKDEAKKREADKTIENDIKDFGTALKNAQHILSNNTDLEKIEEHMRDRWFVVSDVISDIKKLRTALTDAIDAANMFKTHYSHLTEAQKKEYKKDFKSHYDKKAKELLSALEKQISRLEKRGQSLLVTPSANPDYTNAKYYAYFESKNVQDLENFIKKTNDEIQKLQQAGQNASEISKKRKEIEKFEALLDTRGLANLSAVKEKIIKLQQLMQQI